MSQAVKNQTPGEQVISAQLSQTPDEFRQQTSNEDGSNSYSMRVSGPDVPMGGDDNGPRFREGDSLTAIRSSYSEQGAEQSVSSATIAQDKYVTSKKGSILPPRIPKKETDSVYTTAHVIDSHVSVPKEAGTVDVLRKVSTDQKVKDGHITDRRVKVAGTKRTSHAPKGHEGQEYHVNFKDKERQQRYGELVMKLATKRIEKEIS